MQNVVWNNKIKIALLTQKSLVVILTNSISIEINLETDDLTSKNIKTFLSTNEIQAQPVFQYLAPSGLVLRSGAKLLSNII
jgi:hypothetical protein